MELKFKKFKITNNKYSYILNINKDPKNYYYTDFECLLSSIPNKIILKSEAENITELIEEINSLKKEIKKINKNGR